jgi:hypothetical protein
MSLGPRDNLFRNPVLQLAMSTKPEGQVCRAIDNVGHPQTWIDQSTSNGLGICFINVSGETLAKDRTIMHEGVQNPPILPVKIGKDKVDSKLE